ncbi:MAG: HAD-IA family hydrolase [Chlamydiota bacterium]|nr:HAD-IA family hydrolase [Chlamydiota bacterium]
MRKTKAVFFDAGGTLFCPYRSVGDIYADTAKRHGLDVTGEEVDRCFREIWLRKSSLSALESTLDERTWWYELVHEVFLSLGVFDDFDAFFNELHELFARPEIWHLYPEVPGVLETLRADGYILGIVSNWDSRLVALCEKLGIQAHFDFILASAIVGSSKPHRGIFDEALMRAQVKPEEALHIGDSMKDDYEASTALGIQSLLIDRDAHHQDHTFTLASLEDLIPYLNMGSELYI